MDRALVSTSTSQQHVLVRGDQRTHNSLRTSASGVITSSSSGAAATHTSPPSSAFEPAAARSGSPQVNRVRGNTLIGMIHTARTHIHVHTHTHNHRALNEYVIKPAFTHMHTLLRTHTLARTLTRKISLTALCHPHFSFLFLTFLFFLPVAFIRSHCIISIRSVRKSAPRICCSVLAAA